MPSPPYTFLNLTLESLTHRWLNKQNAHLHRVEVGLFSQNSLLVFLARGVECLPTPLPLVVPIPHSPTSGSVCQLLTTGKLSEDFPAATEKQGFWKCLGD